MNLIPLNDSVLFEFLDETSGSQGKFTDRIRSEVGIIIPNIGRNHDSKKPRWGRVLAIGPKVDGISVGEYILIEAMMWSNGTKHDGQSFWKTDPSRIMMVTDDINATME